MSSVSVNDETVTYAEAAEILNVSVRTVHRLREDGKLEPVISKTPRNAASVRFRRADVKALVSSDAA